MSIDQASQYFDDSVTAELAKPKTIKLGFVDSRLVGKIEDPDQKGKTLLQFSLSRSGGNMSDAFWAMRAVTTGELGFPDNFYFISQRGFSDPCVKVLELPPNTDTKALLTAQRLPDGLIEIPKGSVPGSGTEGAMEDYNHNILGRLGLLEESASTPCPFSEDFKKAGVSEVLDFVRSTKR